MGFYLVPSSGTYFSVISFCLTFCVCGLHFSGCRIIAPLAASVCSLVGEAGPGACAGFLVGGTGVCPLVDGAGPCPSGGQGYIKGCVQRWLWAQPVCWWVGLCSCGLFGLSVPALVWRLLGGTRSWYHNGRPPGEFTLINSLWSLCHRYPCSPVSHSWPPLLQETFQDS